MIVKHSINIFVLLSMKYELQRDEIDTKMCDSVCQIDEHHDYAPTVSDLSFDARKPVFGVSDQVRHKPTCTVTDKD